MNRLPDVEAFILAGGVSSRMGRDKALLEFGGIPLVVNTVQLVAPLVSRTTVVGPVEKYANLGLNVIPDRHSSMRIETARSKGPLFGIVTALSNARTPWTLILACDLPYLTAQWLESLALRALESNAQAVIPQTAHGLEPLAAAYRSECAKPLAQLLASGTHKVTDALKALSVEIIPEKDSSVLKNMNTLADYNEALKWRQRRP
ncbi:MAG TPA: molybdenum cofactor guanylyltransferase [Candidatus Acidoferrales bacterium]|nr:molybdenum cofactor guanylyltransferase [Candidatus Acidoferrales bacterium]